MHSMGKTIAELHNMLKLVEKGMPKKAPVVLAINKGRIQKKNKGKPLATGKGQGKGKAHLAYAPKPKIPPPAKKEQPAKDTVCHHGGVVGHWRCNCAAYLEGLKKNKASGASTSVYFAKTIWDVLKKYAKIDMQGNGWKEVVMHMEKLPTGNNIWNVLRRLVLAAVDYGI
ncbi:hypothetical protein CTI12_AA347510 [Artemisia annua]|uniref:Zinc finger, CCHC-type n=1 Tax=Artemisia annua TaxID=35608 RepID=A0A2U1MRX9_ARTAN|nr:hypothetical protein CTI12_AA347510 [Artemisia annua]